MCHNDNKWYFDGGIHDGKQTMQNRYHHEHCKHSLTSWEILFYKRQVQYIQIKSLMKVICWERMLMALCTHGHNLHLPILPHSKSRLDTEHLRYLWNERDPHDCLHEKMKSNNCWLCFRVVLCIIDKVMKLKWEILARIMMFWRKCCKTHSEWCIHSL
jgi:hypothetical protein